MVWLSTNGVAIYEKGVAISFSVSRAPCRSQKNKGTLDIIILHPDLPDRVTYPCVGFSRILNRLTKNIKGLHSGPIYHIGLSALTIHRAQAFSLFPCCTITGQGFMLILIFIL